MRELGANHVLDYTKEDFATDGNRHDLIRDLAGNPSLARLRRALSPTGTVVIVGGQDGGTWTGGIGRQLRAPAVTIVTRQTPKDFGTKERATDLRQLA